MRLSSIIHPAIAAMAIATGPEVTDAAVVSGPSQAAVDAAKAVTLIRYQKGINSNSYTNGAFFGGASIVLAAASHAGNTGADARLLQQIRHLLSGANAICANGGYPAQHERHATGMFAIAKHTPRIWNQLTATEKSNVDLQMKAALVASAFTTSDTNPFIVAGTQQYTLDGDGNIGRDWNPNYREGMVGGVLVGMVYFGGPAATNAILDNYNHAAFLAELAAAGLTNTHLTFNWKTANPASAAPTGSQIQNAVRNYRYKTKALADHMAIYTLLINDTYGKSINSGLNNGTGVNGAGKIASGAANLPNPGASGMLKEFDTTDANGPRSSVFYCYDGYRPHQTNQLVLIIGGYWPKGKTEANQAVSRIKVGNTDLWYKMNAGYIDYHKGQARGTYDLAYFNNGHGFTYVRSLWEDVLLPYHDSASETDSDTDGDGTGDSVEIRLGLDPFNATSRFHATRNGSRLEWTGKSGVSFQIQRTTGVSSLAWTTIATVAGVTGLNAYTDPAPPAGRAFYRVGLLP
jgi:hypothetical protein